MKIAKVQSTHEMRGLAKRYLPRIIFDYIEGGVEDEIGMERNIQALAAHTIVPRCLSDRDVRSQATTLFGTTYASPFGIAPTGMASAVRRDGDSLLAEAAAAADIPFIISGVATGAVERVSRISPRHVWLQVYVARDRAITLDQITIAADAGIKTLVVTVDVPATSKRERDIRNGWVRPYRPSLPAKLEAMGHPAWLARYLVRGIPFLENWRKYAPPNADARGVAAFVSTQIPNAVSWQDLEDIRKAWSGALIIKGIMDPADAVRLQAMGFDGIVVSNHGGRQLDRAPASIDMLPLIHDATKGNVPLIFDSGVRRGSDIVVALSQGASFALAGRAPIYGLAAGGQAGVSRAIAILKKEIELVMAQTGCSDTNQIGRGWPTLRSQLHEQKRIVTHE